MTWSPVEHHIGQFQTFIPILGLQLKVVKGSKFIKIVPQKASNIWQQFRFNHLYSQHRLILILLVILIPGIVTLFMTIHLGFSEILF